eukprot:gene7142-7357_t
MFFVSLRRPTLEQEKEVCSNGMRSGSNFKCAGSSLNAPPLPVAALEHGWWNIDHERIKVGYGKKTYEATKGLLSKWGQFQLPWAQVQPTTPILPGTPVCVAANVFGLWTAVPLQVVYQQEAKWQQRQQCNSSVGRRRRGRQMSYAQACLHTHFLAGEERFKVEWDQSDDSVWYDIYTFSRPAHPLAWIGYPVVRHLQQRFRHDSLRAVARAAAVQTVDSCLDDKTRRRIEQAEAAMMEKYGQLRK